MIVLGDSKSKSLVGKGDISFVIENAAAEMQHKAIKPFAEKFRNAPDDDVRSNALFALSSIGDPIVVAHLGWWFGTCDNRSYNRFGRYVDQVVDRFKGDRRAISILLDGLEGRHSVLSVSDATDLAIHWDYFMPEDVLKRLHNHRDTKLTEKLDEYTKKWNETLKKTH
jgi:hypothetical protein